MGLRSWGEGGCAVVVFEGKYEAQAGLDAIDAALREQAPARGLLLDLSDSSSFRARSADDLRHITSFLATRREQFGSRLATVGFTDLAYGLLRMAGVYATELGMQNEAFRTRAEALEWLCAPRPAPAD